MNAKMAAFVLLGIFSVMLHSVHSIENFQRHNPGSDSITNSTQNSRENLSEHSSPKVLSRRKRYVAFPEGSSFSVSSHSFPPLIE